MKLIFKKIWFCILLILAGFIITWIGGISIHYILLGGRDWEAFSFLGLYLIILVLGSYSIVDSSFNEKTLKGLKEVLGSYSIVDSSFNEKTLKGLKEFREKNWDKTLPRDKAYKKYVNADSNDNQNKEE